MPVLEFNHRSMPGPQIWVDLFKVPIILRPGISGLAPLRQQPLLCFLTVINPRFSC